MDGAATAASIVAGTRRASTSRHVPQPMTRRNGFAVRSAGPLTPDRASPCRGADQATVTFPSIGGHEIHPSSSRSADRHRRNARAW
ncbi:hypothetical protein PJI17_15370 [Mycobacterium kansasii]